MFHSCLPLCRLEDVCTFKTGVFNTRSTFALSCRKLNSPGYSCVQLPGPITPYLPSFPAQIPWGLLHRENKQRRRMRMMPKYEYVLFDMDGTLGNSNAAHANAWV